jgi:dCMP deaminase
MNVNDWDRKFMGLALHIAQWSKDRSRRVGCVIVGRNNEVRATGYNGFPRDVDDQNDERHARPEKYAWTEHAERNAIYNAARIGVSMEGCTIYVPWYPCMDCARGIVQSGIVVLVATPPNFDDPIWGEQFRLVQSLFAEVSARSGFLVRLVSLDELGLAGK